MKSRIHASLLSSITLALFAAPAAQAVTYYWDNDGTTPGFGTAAGTWAAPTTGSITQGFSQDPTGETTPVDVTTGTGDAMNFGTSSLGLVAGTVSVTGTVNAGNITIGSASGAIVIGTNGTNLTLTAAGSGSSTITNNSASQLVLGSSLTGGALIKEGTGQLSLSNATNAYTGTTNINTGTLRIGGAGRLNSGSYAGAISIASGSVLSYGSSVAQTLSGVISGLGSITKNTDTTSTLVLSGASNFSGGVTLNAGILQIGTTSGTYTSLGAAATSVLTINAGTIQTGTSAASITTANNSVWNASFSMSRGTTGTGTWNHQGNVTLGADITVTPLNSTPVLNVSGNIGETGGARKLTIAGGGFTMISTLNGSNTYTGGSNVSGGSSLTFAKLVSMPAAGVVAVSASTVGIGLGGTGEWTTGTSGNGTLGGLLAGLGGQAGSTVTYSGAVAIALSTTGTQTYAGIANVTGSSSTGITKSGTGTLDLSGTNTYTGATTVINGTLNLTGAFGATVLNVNTGATLFFGSTATRGSAGINLNGGKILMGSATPANFTGTILPGTGSFISSDSTTARTFTNRINFNGNFTLGDTINNGKLTFSDISGASGTGSGQRTVTVLSDVEFTMPMNGTNGPIKEGAGTLTFSGANTFAGTTVVSNGRLLVNNTTGSGTGTSMVSVSSGATLGGTGTIDGNTTIAASGKLEFNLSTAVGSHDKLDLAATRTLTFSGASTLTITSSGGATPGTYTLVTAPGGITGSAPATLILPAGWAATTSISGSDLQLNVTSTGGGASPYDTWSSGAAFNVDTNGDGVNNGLAFLLGATNPNVSALDKLPIVTQSSGNLTLVFSMLNAASRGSAALNVEHSNDLGISDPWTAVAVPDVNAGPVSGVTFVVTPGSPSNSVTATISSSESVSGKLFGRLKAVNP